MGELFIPNASPITDTVVVTDVATPIDISAKEYCVFLFDNQGSELVNIKLLPVDKTIKLSNGTFISFEQDEITRVELKCDAGKTTTVMYLIQGNA